MGRSDAPEQTSDLASYVRDLSQVVTSLKTHQHDLAIEVASLTERVDKLQLAFNAFRGRVYAWKRFDPTPEEAPKPTETTPELPLNDPRVTKAELRARLLKPGKPFKHN